MVGEGSISSTEKKNEDLKNVSKLYWDLNLPMDAWDQPYNVEDEASGRDVEGEITADETAAGNGKECQSGYNSEFEDGELREPYPSVDYKTEVEHVNYGSELEDVKCESGDASKIREVNEGSDSEKRVVVNMSDSHPKGSSSSSHDAIRRRRPDNYKELSSGPTERYDRSGMRKRNRSPGRGYYSSWDSKRLFSPPNYIRFGRGPPKSMVDGRGMMKGYDQSGSGHGAGPDGHDGGYRGLLGKFPDDGYRGLFGKFPDDGYRGRLGKFPDDGYRGLLGKFPDGGDRDFRGLHGDTNRMSATSRERGNSSVFMRMTYQQSESRSSPAPPSGSRAEERMRVPFQKQFPADQEMRFMSPPRNRMSTSRFFEERNNDAGENHNNSFRERKSQPEQRFDVGNSTKRPNSDNNNNNNSSHLRPFIRNRRLEDAEENTGMNRFMIAQRQQTPRFEATKDGGDDIGRFRFNREQSVIVAADSNKNTSSKNKESC